MKRFRLTYLQEAKEASVKLPPSIKPLLKESLEALLSNPYVGKELTEELQGFRSLAITRYRIIYEIIEDSKMIEVNLIGHRRDVYAKFKDLLEQTAASIH